MYVAILLVVLGGVYTIISYISNRANRRKLSKIQSEPSVPILGHVLKLGRTSEEFLPSLQRMWLNAEREKFILKVGTVLNVVLTKPEDIEVILSSSVMIEKSIMYKNFKPLIGDSVIISKGNKWRQMRKFQTPAFSFNVLESYVDIFQDEADMLMKEMTAKPGQDLDMYPIFYRRALVAICRAGIGFDIISDKDFNEYINCMSDVIALTGDRVFSSWQSIEFIYNLTPTGKRFKRHLQFIHNKNRMVLENRRVQLKPLLDEVNSGRQTLESITEEMSQKKISFLDLLLLGRKENGECLTNEEIMDEVHIFSIAGHETTSSCASFTVYCLAMHPEIQEKAFQEQLSITGGDLNKIITSKDLQNMPYLECVIKESLRLYSPAVFIGRILTEEVVLPDGTEIPVGSNILLLPFFTHRDPDLFADPEKFDPKRFFEEHHSRYTYFPFSAGPRNCIGKKLAMMEVKFWLATVLRSLELLPPAGEHPKLVLEVVLKSSNGVNVRVRKRLLK